MQTSLEFSILSNFRQCPYWLDSDKGGRADPTGTLFIPPDIEERRYPQFTAFEAQGAGRYPTFVNLPWVQLVGCSCSLFMIKACLRLVSMKECNMVNSIQLVAQFDRLGLVRSVDGFCVSRYMTILSEAHVLMIFFCLYLGTLPGCITTGSLLN